MGILQVFDKFLEDTPPNSKPEPGSMYWAPTSDIDEVTRILEVERATPDEHCITNFEIKQINNEHFTNHQRLPIKKLDLGNTEELIITKAKKRPVVILSVLHTDNIETINSGTQRKLASHLDKTSYLVAPCFSVSSMQNPGTFGPTLVARIRVLKHPHFFCLPDAQDSKKPGSIIRLDRVFPTYLGMCCTPMRKKLHPEPFELLLSQFSIITHGKDAYREPYDLVKSVAQDALPTEDFN